jgi:hypothetical protein
MHAPRPGHLRSASSAITGVCVARALFAFAGCGGPGAMAIPRPAAPPAVADAASTLLPSPEPLATPVVGTPAAGSPVVGGGGCGPDLWVRIKDHLANPAVALVGLVDGCREANIETTLDRSNVSAAVAICNEAAEVAYANGVRAVNVTASDARRIASGAAGSPCAGQP